MGQYSTVHWTSQQCLNWRVVIVSVCIVFLARYEQLRLELENFKVASCVRYLRRSFHRYYPRTALGSRIMCFRWSKNKTFCVVLFQIDQFGKSMHFKCCGLEAWLPPKNRVPQIEATIAAKSFWRSACFHHLGIAPQKSQDWANSPETTPLPPYKTKTQVLSKRHFTRRVSAA